MVFNELFFFLFSMRMNVNGVVRFDTFDARTELKLLQGQVKTDHQQSVKDLQKFLLQKEDNSWLLGDPLINLIADILQQGSDECKIRLLRILALCALKDNFINVLNLDRKRKIIMNHALKFQKLDNINEQKALASLICNLFSNPQTSSYALYFSHWESPDTCNAQIVTDLAKHCLESGNPSLIEAGAGIMFNISIRQVRVLQKPKNEEETNLEKVNLDCEDLSTSELSDGNFVALKAYDDIVVEICSSIWQLLIESNHPLDDQVLNCCLKTLGNFMHMLDFADLEMSQELEKLHQNGKLNQENQQLVNNLLEKFNKHS